MISVTYFEAWFKQIELDRNLTFGGPQSDREIPAIATMRIMSCKGFIVINVYFIRHRTNPGKSLYSEIQ